MSAAKALSDYSVVLDPDSLAVDAAAQNASAQRFIRTKVPRPETYIDKTERDLISVFEHNIINGRATHS